MTSGLLLNLSAVLALVPASALPWRRGGGRDSLFWLLLAVAVAGPAVVATDRLWHGWLATLSVTLWVSIAASLTIFVGVCLVTRHGWRLTPLLLPYLFVCGIIAALADRLPEHPSRIFAPAAWLDAHILVSVATYGLVTIAAIAGLAVFLQERAMKRRRPSRFTALLPAVAEAEQLQISLLAASAIVLGLGLITGIGSQYAGTGVLVEWTHKTVFALAAFATILVLLLVHYRTGLRGRQAARLVLVAYLLLTLAYPGVKFVTDVLLA